MKSGNDASRCPDLPTVVIVPTAKQCDTVPQVHCMDPPAGLYVNHRLGKLYRYLFLQKNLYMGQNKFIVLSDLLAPTTNLLR